MLLRQFLSVLKASVDKTSHNLDYLITMFNGQLTLNDNYGVCQRKHLNHEIEPAPDTYSI